MLVALAAINFAFSQKSASKIFVHAPDAKEKISITNGALSDFVKKWYWVSIQFSDLKLETKDGDYFLLAKDEVNKRTFAFKLMKKDGKAYLAHTTYVNICTCDCMELSYFIIEKGEIIGCNRASHSIVSGL